LFGDDLASYLPEHIRPFAEQLKQFPTGYEKWVYAGSLPSDAYQGDIFGVLPFVHVDDDDDVVRADRLGMVISNTCDAQPDQADYILIAPISDLDDYRKYSESEGELQGEELENHIRALVENKLSQIMFLPETTGFGRAFVDFGNICSISSKSFHTRYVDMKMISLSQYGHYFLLMKLAYHLARPESADAKRT
jgi:hypothetical protein